MNFRLHGTLGYHGDAVTGHDEHDRPVSMDEGQETVEEITFPR